MTVAATQPVPTPAPEADAALGPDAALETDAALGADATLEAAGLRLSLDVTPTEASGGQRLLVTVTVRNQTGEELEAVSITSRQAPGCDRTDRSLDEGQVVTYTCRLTAATEPGQHKVVAIAVARPESGMSGYYRKELRAVAVDNYHIRQEYASPTPRASVAPSQAAPLPITGADVAMVTGTGITLVLVGIAFAMVAGLMGRRRARRR